MATSVSAAEHEERDAAGAKEEEVKSYVSLIALLSVVCTAYACQARASDVAASAPEPALAADVTAINALLGDWVRLYNAGSFEELISVFYAEHAALMSPNQPPRLGREAILRSFRNDAESNNEHCDSSVMEDVRVSGDLAVARGTDTGTSTPRNGGRPVTYSLKWLMAFERQPDRTWKCIYEMWNDNPQP